MEAQVEQLFLGAALLLLVERLLTVYLMSESRWKRHLHPPPLLDRPAGRILRTRALCLFRDMEALQAFGLKVCSLSARRSTRVALEGFLTFALVAALVGVPLEPDVRQRKGTFFGSVVLNFLSSLPVGPNMGVNTRYDGLYLDGGGPSSTPNRGS